MDNKLFCIECGSYNVNIVTGPEVIEVRGEEITLDVTYRKCLDCIAEWENLEDGDDLDMAYRIYRERHNMLQPEDIKELRKQYDLTQSELSKLLGCGLVTITRYEKGMLQSTVHDNMLKLMEEPRNLHAMLLQSPHVIPEEKYNRLISFLSDRMLSRSCEDIINIKHSYESGILSGYSKFDLNKCKQIILYMCDNDGTLKTKLNKELFYCDNLHYKYHNKSITGLRYRAIKYGPVPENYNLIFNTLVAEGLLEVEHIDYGYANEYGEDVVGHKYKSLTEPDLSVFTPEEIKVLQQVKEYFADWSSSDIVDYSHKEDAYKYTEANDLISYKYAAGLSI